VGGAARIHAGIVQHQIADIDQVAVEDELQWEERMGFEEFTYGYALTVHKSQGSQWDNVIVFDESFAFKEDRAKHLYTAVTRAAESVKVFV
jgi:exodeoxyribonuclease V